MAPSRRRKARMIGTGSPTASGASAEAAGSYRARSPRLRPHGDAAREIEHRNDVHGRLNLPGTEAR